jgi:hypothetical protein
VRRQGAHACTQVLASADENIEGTKAAGVAWRVTGSEYGKEVRRAAPSRCVPMCSARGVGRRAVLDGAVSHPHARPAVQRWRSAFVSIRVTGTDIGFVLKEAEGGSTTLEFAHSLSDQSREFAATSSHWDLAVCDSLKRLCETGGCHRPACVCARACVPRLHVRMSFAGIGRPFETVVRAVCAAAR